MLKKLIVPALLLNLIGCGGNSGGSSPSSNPQSNQIISQSTPNVIVQTGNQNQSQIPTNNYIIGVQTVLVCSLGFSDKPSPFSASNLSAEMEIANGIIQKNSQGKASLLVTFLDLSLSINEPDLSPDANGNGGDGLFKSSQEALKNIPNNGQYKHIIFILNGKSGSWGENPGKLIWQTKLPTSNISGISAAICHELGNNWGFADGQSSGLMSSNAGTNTWYSDSDRKSIGW